MAEKTGSNTNIILKGGSVFGTAVQGGSGHKLEVESLSHTEGGEELTANPIGSGLSMANESQRGSTTPTVSIEALARYDDALVQAEALFFGADSITNYGSGTAYCHSFLHQAGLDIHLTSPVTIAFDGGTANVFEYVSCFARSLTVSSDNPTAYVRHAMEFLADQQKISSTTNTNVTLAAATVANTKRVVAKPSDLFAINAQAGAALSGSDKVNITSFNITYEYPLEPAREIKNASGNGLPIATGTPPFAVTLVVTLRSQSDMTWFTAMQAGTEYKAELTITGDTISGAMAYQRIYSFPRLKLITDVEANLTSPALNPMTLTFKALAATSAPSGMISGYPYIRVTNTRAARYTDA